MLDTGLAGLVHHVLDDRPVDDVEHLLRHGLGGRQEPGPETGDREDSFANAFHEVAVFCAQLRGKICAEQC